MKFTFKLGLIGLLTIFASFGFGPSDARSAPITFEHVCTSLVACDNDAQFSFSVTLDDTVVIANGSYNTVSDGGAAFLGWEGSSSVGDGFVISGGFADRIGAPTGLTFTFDGSEVLSEVIVNGSSFVVRFIEIGVGEIAYVHSSNTRFDYRSDYAPSTVTDGDNIIPNWAVAAVPLPAALPLFGTGLGLIALFGWFRRRRAVAAV